MSTLSLVDLGHDLVDLLHVAVEVGLEAVEAARIEAMQDVHQVHRELVANSICWVVVANAIIVSLLLFDSFGLCKQHGLSSHLHLPVLVQDSLVLGVPPVVRVVGCFP